MAQLLANIDVDDLERAADFYAVLGLKRGRRYGDTVLELSGAAVRVFLLARAAGSPPYRGAPGRSYARHWTPVHLEFAVDDVEASVAAACAAGARLEGAIGDFAFGRLAVLADPFGHGFCLIQFNPRGYAAGLEPRPREA
ncbi:MAG: VOC family protein [Deltaproteobacteria bacterium]|nr:VOC family protein [Deltaproteobacteria bacterium]